MNRTGAEYYQYNFLLAQPLVSLVNQVVVEFAREHGLEYDLWYRGLPTWIVSGHYGHRVNMAQVDAVTTAAGNLLSFSPDAYEDSSELQEGIAVRIRRFSPGEAILSRRINLDVEQLLAPDKQQYEGGADAVIRRSLSAVWEAAAELALTEADSWEQPMPLSS